MNCPNGKTALGTKPSHTRTVACDAKLLGKRIYLEGIGERVCEDTGGAIAGQHIDLYVKDITEAKAWGVKQVKFEVL